MQEITEHPQSKFEKFTFNYNEGNVPDKDKVKRFRSMIEYSSITYQDKVILAIDNVRKDNITDFVHNKNWK